MPKSQRGFASMDADRQREIASKGGRAAHEKGTAHEFSTDEARNAGRKGGQAVSRNRDHMAEIGRKGGESVSRNRDHMSEIGRDGGHVSRSMSMDDHNEEGARESKAPASKTNHSQNHTTSHETNHTHNTVHAE